MREKRGEEEGGGQGKAWEMEKEGGLERMEEGRKKKEKMEGEGV